MDEEPINGSMNRAQMAAYLDQPLLARLATASPRTGQPHVVPVWYLWDGESLWISAFSSTRKVRELEKNRKCSVVIDTSPDANVTRGVLFEGEAELIEAPRSLVEEMSTRIYTRYLGPEGVLAPDPQSWIRDAENRIVKLTPRKTWTW